MQTYTSLRKKIVNLAEVFPWAEGKDYSEAIRGHRGRWKAMEHNLPILEKKGLLESTRWPYKKIYRLSSTNKIKEEEIDHDLMCTRIALDFMHTPGQWEFVSERFLKAAGFTTQPEWIGIKDEYFGVALEYSTADNFRRKKKMKEKLINYDREVYALENYFEIEIAVLFIFDVPRWKVKNFFQKYGSYHFAYFVDLKNFRQVEKGKHIDEEVYLYGGDGKIHSLWKEKNVSKD